MADELPTFGNVALDQEINKNIDNILGNLHADILDLVSAELPKQPQPEMTPKASIGPITPPVASVGSSANTSIPGPPVAFVDDSEANKPTFSNDSNKPGFFHNLWQGTKKAWNSGKEWLKRNLGGSAGAMPSSPMSTKLGYGLGGAWSNFKRGWDKGVQHRGKTWESFCSSRIAEVLFKEECQDYFALFNESKRISLIDYANASGTVNYYIEEALYAYLDGLNWSNTILENDISTPIGTSDVNTGANFQPIDSTPKDPLAEIKNKITEKISKYRVQIANLLKTYASQIHAAQKPEPVEPAVEPAQPAAEPAAAATSEPAVKPAGKKINAKFRAKNKKLAEKPKEDNPSVTEPPASTPPPPESAQDWQGPVTDLF